MEVCARESGTDKSDVCKRKPVAFWHTVQDDRVGSKKEEKEKKKYR